jgi:hypothetical protein
MLAAKPKTKRFLESIQILLTFASVCAVVETTRLRGPLHEPLGYYASVPQPSGARGDRRLADLARTERKRREAEQQASRRGAKLGIALEQRQLRA